MMTLKTLKVERLLYRLCRMKDVEEPEERTLRLRASNGTL